LVIPEVAREDLISLMQRHNKYVKMKTSALLVDINAMQIVNASTQTVHTLVVSVKMATSVKELTTVSWKILALPKPTTV
jgi:ribosome-interacting GTPase 1